LRHTANCGCVTGARHGSVSFTKRSHFFDGQRSLSSQKSGWTRLANVDPEGLPCPALLRATLVLAVGLGLGSGSSALAAPPTDTPVSNPFQDEAGDDASAPADEAAAPAEDEAVSEDEGAEEGSESSLHALTCLEGDATGGRRKGVQRRDFLKKHRFELSAVGGYYASDALSSTYNYGGALAFYPSEDFGLEVLVTRMPVQFRLEEPFGSFTQQRHFTPGTAWQGIASMLWSPIHAKFKFTEDTIIHGDVFAVAGAGRTFHESVMGLTWEAGVGLKLYLSKYVTFRVDVRDFLMPQEVLGRGRITNNLTAMGGLSVWLL
jgi:outer membrane beta-barrel protein